VRRWPATDRQRAGDAWDWRQNGGRTDNETAICGTLLERAGRDQQPKRREKLTEFDMQARLRSTVTLQGRM